MRVSTRSDARRRSAFRSGNGSIQASPAARVPDAVEAPIRFPVEGPGGFRTVLAFTAFRNIWFAQLAAQLADKFLLFSLIILAYNVSGGSTPVAVTLLTYTVPAVLLAPPAGVLADRVNRKQLMMWCNFGRGAAIALIPIAALVPWLKNDFAHLLLITFVFSAVGQLFGPAEAAVIPTILPRSALITANSMALLTMVLTLVFGGALAPILSRIDLYAPYWVGAARLAFARSLLFASDMPRPLAISMIAFGITMLGLAAVPQAMTQVPDLRVHARLTGGVFSLLLGVEFGAIMIPAVTYLMESTSDEIRGRIFSLLYMVINGVTAIPVLAAAALSDLIGTAHVIGGLGGLLVVTALAIVTVGRRAIEPGLQ